MGWRERPRWAGWLGRGSGVILIAKMIQITVLGGHQLQGKREKEIQKLRGFSERLFRTMADLVVSEGYAAAGYEYINVDDCWLEKERSIHGQLVPDRTRFPSGMKALSDYVSNGADSKKFREEIYTLSLMSLSRTMDIFLLFLTK